MFRVMGSTYFFKDYPDFESKDIDYWEILESSDFNYCRTIVGTGKPKVEFFSFQKLNSAEDHINQALISQLPMVVGKFLIPEFCQEIGFTIADLPRMQPLIDTLDEKHLYEKIIYEAYLQNGNFYLTQEQRDLAYTSYKEARSQ